jgi:RNA polymerase sigma factor (sigma-70 family)
LSVSAPTPHTTQLHHWIARMRAGNLSARDELLRCVCGRLERLARRLLQRFPAVSRWVEAEDVPQNALLRALESVRPASMRDFFGLAAEQMRGELLGMVRHFYGPQGDGAHHDSVGGQDDSHNPGNEPPDQVEEPGDLERWSRFHEMARLPAEEREVVSLVFYRGWQQAAVAELLQISVRTVRRRWESALVTLHARVIDEGEGA